MYPIHKPLMIHPHKILICVFLSLFPVAVVGLEKTFYSVSEDVGVVEVCAIVYSPTIDCPIAFPFDVGLSTLDNTAGNILVDAVLLYIMLPWW